MAAAATNNPPPLLGLPSPAVAASPKIPPSPNSDAPSLPAFTPTTAVTEAAENEEDEEEDEEENEEDEVAAGSRGSPALATVSSAAKTQTSPGKMATPAGSSAAPVIFPMGPQAPAIGVLPMAAVDSPQNQTPYFPCVNPTPSTPLEAFSKTQKVPHGVVDNLQNMSNFPSDFVSHAHIPFPPPHVTPPHRPIPHCLYQKSWVMMAWGSLISLPTFCLERFLCTKTLKGMSMISSCIPHL